MGETSSDAQRLVRFGVYELDLLSGELRKSGARLSLQHQPLQLLSVLLDRPGELVTREELRKRLWPDDTFVDFEHGLNAAVRRLRDTLGDSADSPRFVETVPRRGYRFIAPASGDDLNPRLNTATANKSPLSFPRLKRGWPFLVAGLVIVIGCLWAYIEDRRVRSSSPLTVVPFTTFPGQEVAPTFSRDGSQIAFAWSPEGPQDQFDLYVKVIGSERPLQLTKRPADFIFPAWSPDGRRIAFARMSREGSGIYQVSPLGGPEQKLADAHFEYFTETMLSWSPDGKLLAYRDKGPSGQFGIFLLDVVTSEKRWWGSLSADCMTSLVPAFSPDGKSLAVVCMASYNVNDLFVLPASGGTGRRIARVQGDFTGMTWTADGGSLIYSADGDLFRVAASGAQPEKLLAGRDARMPAISNDGQRLTYATQTFLTINLWQAPLAASTRSAGPPVKLVSSSRTHGRPSFSPDGSRLAFESDRSGTPEIWTSDADGSTPWLLQHLEDR